MTSSSTTVPSSTISRTARGRALVRMFETVSSSHSTSTNANDEIDDLHPLLLLMDIGSCASAEKHTRVNCVTASMGDVVIEHFPRVGELLELRASPVSVGRTSLNINVLVVAHGSASSSGDDSNNDDGEEEAQTNRVCEAFFTYVTTRGPNGEKRYCPPLDGDEAGDNDGNNNNTGSDNDNVTNIILDPRKIAERKWERTLAHFRKELIRSEQTLVKLHQNNIRAETTTTAPNIAHYNNSHNNSQDLDFLEMSEVVLPQNQNHMKNLFGGVVMGWMCKSVIAACTKVCRLPLTKFRIRAIHRVDFPQGASVSDHVFFRPRLTAIFEDGRGAEFEVKVGKRNITGTAGCSDNQSSTKNEEQLMNVGHFYVSGVKSYFSDPKTGEYDGYEDYKIKTSTTGRKLSTDIAPFAKLMKTHPFLVHINSNISTNTNMAYQRRKSLLARRNLLAGLGQSIEWDSSLKIQAPLLTILSVLRLCDQYEQSKTKASQQQTAPLSSLWRKLTLDSAGTTTTSISISNQLIEWALGDYWGHKDTVLLHGKTLIRRKRSSSGSSSSDQSFLELVYGTIMNKRPEWDPACISVTVLEKDIAAEANDDDSTEDRSNEVDYDIVEYHIKTAVTTETKVCLLRAGSHIDVDNDDTARISITKSESGSYITKKKRTSSVVASRSVLHEKSDAVNQVLPSGWLLKAIDGNDDDDDELIEITYISEHNFNKLRETAFASNKDVTDEYIANILGSYLGQWFTNLASFDHSS